jgi:hypothetical protein
VGAGWGKKGTGEGEFSTLHGLSLVPGSTEVVVADRQNSRLQLFNARARSGGSGEAAADADTTGLHRACGLAAGRALVTSRVCWIRRGTMSRATISPPWRDAKASRPPIGYDTSTQPAPYGAYGGHVLCSKRCASTCPHLDPIAPYGNSAIAYGYRFTYFAGRIRWPCPLVIQGRPSGPTATRHPNPCMD